MLCCASFRARATNDVVKLPIRGAVLQNVFWPYRLARPAKRTKAARK